MRPVLSRLKARAPCAPRLVFTPLGKATTGDTHGLRLSGCGRVEALAGPRRVPTGDAHDPGGGPSRASPRSLATAHRCSPGPPRSVPRSKGSTRGWIETSPTAASRSPCCSATPPRRHIASVARFFAQRPDTSQIPLHRGRRTGEKSSTIPCSRQNSATRPEVKAEPLSAFSTSGAPRSATSCASRRTTADARSPGTDARAITSRSCSSDDEGSPTGDPTAKQ